MPATRKLLLIAVSRFGTCIATMVFAGSLPYLLAAWSMTAAQAGAVQAAYNLAYAASLLVASWLADRVGAKPVFLASIWGTAAAFLAFAIGARSYPSALILFAIVGLAQGGSYTPALMLVADAVAPARRGRAMGWTLAAGSLGYLVSLLLSVGGATLASYRHGFYAGAVGPLIGAVAGTLALLKTPNIVHRRVAAAEPGGGLRRALLARPSILLTLGYTAHCWELLGMWAWTPAFLAAAFQDDGFAASPLLAVGIAVPIHLAGFLASLAMGDASDRWGRRRVLVAMALAGAVLSSIFGWLIDLPPPFLLGLAFLYGFAALGDSGVLSTAMTEAVAPRHLGTALALRSLLGFGAGALSPLVFGWVLDATNPAGGLPRVWGWAFAALGVGGAIATACALMLPRSYSPSLRKRAPETGSPADEPVATRRQSASANAASNSK